MAGGRPSKPLVLVQGHRTKAEKEIRQKAEKELLTGVSLKEWPEVKADPISHKEFTRIKKLLKLVKQDDDLYGMVINTYCKLKAEEDQMLKVKDEFIKSLDKLENGYTDGEMTYNEYIKLLVQVQGQITSCDKAIMQKRKLMLEISKENIMTIQSSLRSIPKKPEEKKDSPMMDFLKQRQAR